MLLIKEAHAAHVGIHSRPSNIKPNVPLVEIQTNLVDEIKLWKLEVVHRDRIHPSRFQQRMKRDANRMANLIRQLDEYGVYYPKVESFNEDVGSDSGSGEYFIPIGLVTPPTPQYLVIDIGSDIVVETGIIGLGCGVFSLVSQLSDQVRKCAYPNA